MRGTDSFQAICLAIEFVRKALRAFIVHGGRVYYQQTKTPIDLDDYAFARQSRNSSILVFSVDHPLNTGVESRNRTTAGENHAMKRKSPSTLD